MLHIMMTIRFELKSCTYHGLINKIIVVNIILITNFQVSFSRFVVAVNG